MTWSQIYDPLNFWQLSTFVSSLPVLTLFFVLLVLKQRVWIAALSGMIMAVVLAAAVFGMPASLISNATFLGVVLDSYGSLGSSSPPFFSTTLPSKPASFR